MSDQVRESMSAMLDGEANDLDLQRVLGAVGSDDEVRQAWRRYHAARVAMTGNATEHLSLDVSSRVREAIEGGADSSRLQRLMRPFASLAVAASVAATVVIGGQQLAMVSGDDPYVAQSASTAGVSPVGMINSLGAMPVRASYGTESVPSPRVGYGAESVPAARAAYKDLARQRMQLYMQEHAEHAALNSPQGLIPFARVPEIHE